MTLWLERGSYDHTDSYRTPIGFYNKLDSEFNFEDFDPCPFNLHFNPVSDFDGLREDWPDSAKTIFVNPPYSQSKKWIEKAIQECLKGKTIVLLLKADTSTNYFHDLIEPFAEVRFVKGKICFDGKREAPFPSMLVIYRANSFTDKWLAKRKVCLYCGKVFTAKRSDAKFCSINHRVLAWQRLS